MFKEKIKYGTINSRARFLARLLYSKICHKPSPLLVTFSLTARCPFDCVYCYGNYKSRHAQEEEITTEQALQAIEELADMGMSFLQLSGGEPLVRDDIDLIVDKANELGITLGISTNGSLVEEKIKTIKKIKTICISYDGEEQSNDANRGKGTYRIIMRAISAAKQAGVNVHTYTTVNKNNLRSIESIIEFSRKFNIYAEFGFPVVRSLKNDQDYQGLDLDIEEFRSAVEKLLHYKKRGYPILFSAKVMEMILKWPDYSQKIYDSEGNVPFQHIRCYAGRHMVFIDCDGKVYPCIQFIGNFKALDFREAGIKRAVEHSARHNCKACYLMCVNDFNLMFGLDHSVLYNYLRITLEENLKKDDFDPAKFVS